MKNNLLISVVVPAHNEEKFIPDCLASLKNQDFHGEYEIVFIDNNSSDRSKEIAGKFGIKVLDCAREGIFYVRQEGASRAAGDIVVQADADTVYPPDWLSKISKHFFSRPDIIAVAGRCRYKDPPYWAGFEYFLRIAANLLCLALFKKPLVIAGANFAFRKESFFKIGGYRKDSFSLDQYDVVQRLSKLGKIIYDKELIAFTSSRRVRKPLLLIFFDFLYNLFSIFAYFFKSVCATLRRTIRRPQRIISDLRKE